MWPNDFPDWESDFWRDLLDNRYDQYMGTPTGRFHADPYPEDIGDTVEGVSPYWTEDTLVGEIVEEEPKALTGK
jgi:hypothetical protein